MVLPATATVGSLIEAGSPACLASALIALGVMSGVPTICSRARLLWTVLRPLTPRTIAAIPKATSTMLAAAPPYSKSLRVVNMATPFASFLFMPQVSIGLALPASGRCRRLVAAFPQAWRGFWRGRFARTGLYDWPAMATARESDRLRTLLETGIAISSELSLDTVLERIVEAAAALTGARYAALGVIDRSGTALERFVTTGFDEETRAAIGDLPRGRRRMHFGSRPRRATFPSRRLESASPAIRRRGGCSSGGGASGSTRCSKIRRSTKSRRASLLRRQVCSCRCSPARRRSA